MVKKYKQQRDAAIYLLKKRKAKNYSDYFRLMAYMCFAFWIVLTGVLLVPILAKSPTNPIAPFVYSMTILISAVLVLYKGLKPLIENGF